MLDNCTNRITKLKYPLLYKVIPMIDKIHGNLSKRVVNQKYLPCICAAIAQGITLLNKYYALIDNSIMWRTAMCIYFYMILAYFY